MKVKRVCTQFKQFLKCEKNVSIGTSRGLKYRKCTYMKKKIEKSEKEKQKHDPSENGSSSVVGRYPPSSKLAMGRGMEDANRFLTIFIKTVN